MNICKTGKNINCGQSKLCAAVNIKQTRNANVKSRLHPFIYARVSVIMCVSLHIENEKGREKERQKERYGMREEWILRYKVKGIEVLIALVPKWIRVYQTT